MEGFRAINTDADEKIRVCEKFAPVLVEKRTVGLEAILHVHISRRVFLLELDDLAKEINSQERWPSSLPSERND